jgi:hypothetical protein
MIRPRVSFILQQRLTRRIVTGTAEMHVRTDIFSREAYGRLKPTTRYAEINPFG